MLKLNNLKSPKGANKDTKRIGRGVGSGWGCQAGKGHKGQKARSGGGVRPGFEGGSMPIYRRLPKRGFSNDVFKVEFATVNLSVINEKYNNEEVNRNTLIEKGIIKGINKKLAVKILGDGKLTKALSFKGIEKFSKSAKESIEKVGGKIN
ncbi:MAG: 50S ribosomal protein L15 [Bdellovibrionales bacterium RIFOXYA1_FULL_36_14]|nr:MAG: 50S ribosomal protein L15 [Bdellovibrionales bacterium RIFOXYA1_FULL_36_14]